MWLLLVKCVVREIGLSGYSAGLCKQEDLSWELQDPVKGKEGQCTPLVARGQRETSLGPHWTASLREQALGPAKDPT